MKSVRYNLFFLPLAIFLIMMACATGYGQSKKYRNFNKNRRNFQKKKYRPRRSDANRACARLYVKKYNYKPRKVNLIASKGKSKSVPLAEYDPDDTPPPRPKPKPEPVAAKEDDMHNKSFEEQTLEERHQIEDEVLEKNNLPKPTSKKHEEIRKKVQQKLKEHKEGDPIELAPLYFTFDQDEFSVVDFEPFLVAVEYALQGRIILIEGHTDSQGRDTYNVKLSIERVEKIRSLMHDMGVPDDRISVVGYGEEQGKHDNTTEEGRQKNRRVDFTVF